MPEATRNSTNLPAATALDGEEFRELRAAQNRAQKLREQTMTRERERLVAIAAILEVSLEELVGLPKRQRRSKTTTA